jgi:hypothetical protein
MIISKSFLPSHYPVTHLVSYALDSLNYTRSTDLKEQALFCSYQNNDVILLWSQDMILCITVCSEMTAGGDLNLEMSGLGMGREEV